jgi:hypothetical protein
MKVQEEPAQRAYRAPAELAARPGRADVSAVGNSQQARAIRQFLLD